MKRIVSLFLLLVFAVNLLGVTILFEVQQYQIKQDIKRQIQRGIPESQLCVIRVNETNESAVWWLEEDEFFYDGNMYDVVKKRTIDENKVDYYCVNDVLEKELYGNLDTLAKQHPARAKGLGDIAKKLANFLSSLYFLEREILSLCQIIRPVVTWSFSAHYESIYPSLTSPPPQILSAFYTI